MMLLAEEVTSSDLHVEEFRNSHNLQPDFPDGVATKGLPALVLIFHPYNAGAFDMTCEGLARRNGTLGWQVHFRQRSDKPNLIRAYRSGVNGKTYSVALKGRAIRLSRQPRFILSNLIGFHEGVNQLARNPNSSNADQLCCRTCAGRLT